MQLDARAAFSRVVLLGGALAFAGCSVGAEGLPEVSFSFTSSGGLEAEGEMAAQVVVVLATTLEATGSAVSVKVANAGTGSATAGVDYAAFEPITVEFPAGSRTGATQAVTFELLADAMAEGANETLNLVLTGASGGVSIGQTTYSLAIADAEQAQLGFVQNSSSSPDESSNPYSVDVELRLLPGVALGFDAQVVVRDSQIGTATSASDYEAFPSTTVTIPAGSPSGTTVQVLVEVIDDVLAEGAEDLRLSLVANSSGAGIGSIGDHTFTIVDDDGGASPSLTATHGALGVENALAHGDSLDLGGQTVGAGPNTGTRLRIANSGGSAMELGPPVLSGSHANDFVVELELAPLPPVGGFEAYSTPSVDAPLPLDALPPSGGTGTGVGTGVTLRVDEGGLAALANLTRARLHGFPVPGLGEVTLELERVPLPIAHDAVLMVDGVPVPGGPRAVLSDLTTWRGAALEIPGSRAFISFTSGGPQGFLELPFEHRRLVHLYTEAAPTASTPALCRVVHEEDLVSEGGLTRPDLCGGAVLPPGGERRLPRAPRQAATGTPGEPGTPPLAGITITDCRLAIETDYQLYQKFNSVQNTTDYVTQLIAAISDQYFTDVQTTLSIAYLGVYSSASDPWTEAENGGGTPGVLEEFRSAWANGGWPASADLAHFISGANLGGGLAYLGVLCNQTYGFGVSGNINGNINWGSWTGQPASFTWDFMVVAHELGHNFGADHTHNYCPPLDQCASNCNATTACSQGTLMSYCHSCGGMDNIDLNFHQVVADVMREEVASSCLNRTSMAPGDYVQYRVRFAPLSSTGARSALLEFSHDAPNVNQPLQVNLSGTGN